MKHIVQRVGSPVFVEAHIADIHFGAIDPSKQFTILKEQFLDYLERMNVLDIVSINGDIFDHKFMANSDAIMYACNFINILVDICRRKNTTLIIIAGTALHDADQLKLFYHYSNIVDIRVVEQARFEYIKGKTVLIIPELYGKGKEYYNNLLYSSSYDACYMHGTYKGAVYGKDIPDLDSLREPVFSIQHFAMCKGPIISGHIHKAGCFDKHFYYCGSPYRWQYGQEEDKGFIILLHNINTMKYYVHFEPITSFRYDTVNLDDMLVSDPKEVIDWIKKRQSEGIHNIRVQFNRNEEEKINVIRSYFRNDSSVRIDADFKNDKVMKEVQENNLHYDEYSYMFDRSASPYDILARYINQQEDSQFITSEELIKMLSEEI